MSDPINNSWTLAGSGDWNIATNWGLTVVSGVVTNAVPSGGGSASFQNLLPIPIEYLTVGYGSGDDQVSAINVDDDVVLTLNVSGGDLTSDVTDINTLIESGGVLGFFYADFSNTITQTGGTLSIIGDEIDSEISPLAVEGGGSFAGTLEGDGYADLTAGTYTFNAGFVDNIPILNVDTAVFAAPVTIPGYFLANAVVLAPGPTSALTLDDGGVLGGTIVSANSSAASLTIGNTGSTSMFNVGIGANVTINVAADVATTLNRPVAKVSSPNSAVRCALGHDVFAA